MREIKFRAWDKKLKYMQDFSRHKCGILYEFGSFQVSSGYNSLDEPTFNNDTSEDWEIMQFTGLKDKDGVDIYEGDILRYVNKSRIETLTAEVKYIDDGFYVIEGGDCYHCLSGICSNASHEGSHVGFVIGNIHENPELLE